MGRFFCISVLFLGITEGVCPHTIPKELWGTWVITREVPTTTISCWGEKEAKKLIGNELEYSTQLFRWRSTITKNPTAETKTISAQQFHDENSGGGASDSQVTFRQLGIKQDKVIQISIQHPAASIFGSTTEIPGDTSF